MFQGIWLLLLIFVTKVRSSLIEFELYANSSSDTIDGLGLTVMPADDDQASVYLSTDLSNATTFSYNSSNKVISFEIDQVFYLSIVSGRLVGVASQASNFSLNSTDSSLWTKGANTGGSGLKEFYTHLEIIESELNVNNVTYFPVSVGSSTAATSIALELLYKEDDITLNTNSLVSESSTKSSSSAKSKSSSKNDGGRVETAHGLLPIMVAFFAWLI
ncbi:hypothetical protein CLIB1423_04S07448 [[Candida] railenensis]|uniref:Uncharacterized protein n=1 Tax=[Candida] railenensis TaxID=45579 RepID=A0A9P0QNY6_9ASCO|nr:hypothetical protein CLIB1423_04S07448 [[Candida] railenensis]